jgi:hypothetical protein
MKTVVLKVEVYVEVPEDTDPDALYVSGSVNITDGKRDFHSNWTETLEHRGLEEEAQNA